LVFIMEVPHADCTAHDDMIRDVATITEQTRQQTTILKDFKDEVRAATVEQLRRIDAHLSADGHPIALQSLAGISKVQDAQVTTLQAICKRLDGHSTRLHDVEKVVEPLPDLIESTKYGKSLRDFLGPIIVGVIALGGQVVIKFWPAAASATRTMMNGQ
jgi:hypothetical protein